MGREAKITYEKIAAAADAMCGAGAKPTARTIRERLGNAGSMGTVNRLLQEWRASQERHLAQSLTLPPALQRTILDFLAQELGAAKASLETALVEQRQEMDDLAIENERQAADIDDRMNTEGAIRAELATLQGRISQTEGELANARRETAAEREEAAKARIELAKALLRLEAMPRLEADLVALRTDLKTERQGRNEATQRAAVLEAKLEAALERAVQAEAIGIASLNGDAGRRETGRADAAERRRQQGQKT